METDGELALFISDSEVRVFVFQEAIIPEGFKPDLSDLKGQVKVRLLVSSVGAICLYSHILHPCCVTVRQQMRQE